MHPDGLLPKTSSPLVLQPPFGVEAATAPLALPFPLPDFFFFTRYGRNMRLASLMLPAVLSLHLARFALYASCRFLKSLKFLERKQTQRRQVRNSIERGVSTRAVQKPKSGLLSPTDTRSTAK